MALCLKSLYTIISRQGATVNSCGKKGSYDVRIFHKMYNKYKIGKGVGVMKSVIFVFQKKS